MTSRERVLAAMRFTTPDRLPVDVPSLGKTDILWNGWKQIGTGDHSQLRTVDEWGCTWGRTEVKNMGQVVGHPLPDWADLDKMRWPDPDDPALYEGMEARAAQMGEAFRQTGIFMVLFERLHALRGFENTLTDLYLEREKIEELADRIVEYDVRIIENIAARLPGQIDGISFTDDWGTERATFISPQLFRAFFVPRYRRVFDACHKAGWMVTLHSCGKVDAFLEDLIEAGLNCANLQQPRVFDLDSMHSRFAGRLCFSTLCDIQHTLPFRDEPYIREEAKLLLDKLAAPTGGFILSDYGDGEAIGVPLEKKVWMLDAFEKNDPWRE